MIIDKVKGSHSVDDQIILVTTEDKEAVTLQNVMDLVYNIVYNELSRIRKPAVRLEIIEGFRPFYIEEMLKNVLLRAKNDHYIKLKN